MELRVADDALFGFNGDMELLDGEISQLLNICFSLSPDCGFSRKDLDLSLIPSQCSSISSESERSDIPTGVDRP